MKKAMICIWGAENYGKSETIAEAYNSMTRQNRQKDFLATFSYKNHTVTVQTAGDCPANLKALEQEVQNKNPDFVVCATRTRGETVKAAENIAKNCGFEMIWVSTVYNPSMTFNIASMNQDCGAFIQSVIDNIISGRY